MATTEILNKIRGFFSPNTESFQKGDGTGLIYANQGATNKRGLAELGMQFVVTNPTPGTAIARSLNASFVDTIAMFVVANPAGSGKNIWLDTLRLLLSGTAPAGTTVMHFATFVDKISRAPVTGSNALAYVPVPLNGNVLAPSVATVLGFPASAAVMTIPAKGPSCRQNGRFSLQTSLGITGDEYLVQFGGGDHAPQPGLTAVRATAAAKVVTQAQEMCIAPGEWGVINQWWLTEATNVPNYEFELAWTEKQA